MRIGLDARTLASPLRTGVEQYVINLVRAFSTLTDMPEIIAYTDQPISDSGIAHVGSSGQLRITVVRARRGWLRLALPWRMRRDRIHVAHFPSTILPPFLPCPAVVTVHDLAWTKFPEAYAADDLRMQHLALRSAACAAHIIAVSSTTANDLVAHNINREKITVTPLGISPRFTPEGPRLAPDAFPGAERLQQGYILYVGRLQTRKNISRLLDAYHLIIQTQAAPPLVVVGGQSEYGTEMAHRAQELGMTEYVFFPGHLPDEMLPALFRSATVFTYVSRYEGFGMPVLEAMASGTPVITSNIGGTAEVADEAALLVDPEQVEEIAAALRSLLRDTRAQATYRERGLRRAQQFSWEETARKTIDVYRQVASA